MIELSVMYPKQEGKRFNLDYYLKDHFALVQQTWGSLMKEASVVRGVSGGAADAPPTYQVVARIRFRSMEDLQQALGTGGELFADIPNFTDIKPTVQVSEVVG